MSRSTAQPATRRQADRRNEILDAAQRCFVRSGFHEASMQDICTEAGMSPGNLYRYFPSKEALIAGIAERDRAELARSFAEVDLSEGVFAAIARLAQYHFAERPVDDVLLCTEVMAQARRHPDIRAISRSYDIDVSRWLRDLFEAGMKRGDIPADVDLDGAITMLMTIADGLWWRRALDPDFQPEKILPLFMDIARHLLRSRPRPAVTGDA